MAEEKKIIRRLNIIRGQIAGLTKLIENKADCEKILPQIKAVKNAFSSVSNEIIKAQLSECLPSSKSDKIKKLENILNSFSKF